MCAFHWMLHEQGDGVQCHNDARVSDLTVVPMVRVHLLLGECQEMLRAACTLE